MDTAATIKAWNASFDQETALWWADSPGHTAAVAQLPRVRPIPSAAARLVTAAQFKLLSYLPVERILNAIGQAQVADASPKRGCFRWYYEESQPVDTNAAFFTGLSLISLRLGYFDQLDKPSQRTLSGLLSNLLIWFQRAVAHRQMNYPNKYLGDLVCCWLLMEINGIDDEEHAVEKALIDAAHYWDHHHWGWGEHMSDIYAAVCLDELSMLLLMSRHLPGEARFAYQKLFDKLMTIEDEFDDGPRVPAIRSYAFTTSPKHRSYRESVLPLDAPTIEQLAHQPNMPRNDALNRFGNRPMLGPLFYDRRWHETAIARKPRGHDVRVNCFGNAMASARIERDIRLGSMSSFPIMPASDQATWGLSWQCFPIALWRSEGDWGFLQWETRSGNRARAHPAEEKRYAYLDNALTTSVNPPIVGRTFAIQQGGQILALRLMPMIAGEWDQLRDRFRLLQGHAELHDAPPQTLEGGQIWSQRLLRWPDRAASIQSLPLVAGLAAESFKRETFDQQHAQDWDITVDRKQLAALRCVPLIWGVSLNGRVDSAPVVTVLNDPRSLPRQPEERMLQIIWEWPGVKWNVIVDPLSSSPMLEV